MLSPTCGSRQRIRHPGPAAEQRKSFVRGSVRSWTVRLPAGAMLMDAISQALQGCQGGAVFLSIAGLRLRSGNYVLPAESPDAQHVAWYSATHAMGACKFMQGTVVVGRKEGQWFAHCHALWQNAEGQQALGHVLCDDACIAEPWDAVFHVFSGGGLRVTFDPETQFSLLTPYAQATPGDRANAVLMTLKPHEDVRSALNEVCSALQIDSAKVMGVGSLIGAAFVQEPPMTSALSEMFLLPGAVVARGQCTALPVACVNPDAVIYQGDLLSGQGPVLITCELLLIEAGAAHAPGEPPEYKKSAP